MTPSVEFRHITRRFGEVTANRDISLTVYPGEVLGLVGGNGAGKSTLMNILSGLIAQNSGELLIDGRKVTLRNPADAVQLGIGMVHQEFLLVDALNGLDNVILGHERAQRGIIDRPTIHNELTALAARYQLSCPLDPPVETLTMGQRLRLEILKVLYRQARILILDEPTSVLTPEESKLLYAVIRQFRDNGATVIFISHKLPEVTAVCDRIAVMRDGCLVGERAAADIDTIVIAGMMMGEETATEIAPETSTVQLTPCLKVQNLSVTRHTQVEQLTDISFSVEAGEIFGIAGVEGNGQFALECCLTGYITPDTGSISLDRHDLTGQNPATFRNAGVGWIPSDRNRLAAISGMSLADNIAIGAFHGIPDDGPALVEFGRLHKPRIEAKTEKLLHTYDVRFNHTSQNFKSLSGGNQQRTVFARELSRMLQLLVAAQPTRGVDIHGSRFLHRQLQQAAGEGVAVVVISADLDELFALCRRVGVLYNGVMTGIVAPSPETYREVGRLMAGRKSEEAIS
jgi:general nucleoside transport system ATP-binding protein